MVLTPEQEKRINDCQTPEELVEVAKELDYEMTLEEAQLWFKEADAEGEMSEAELENVEGGSQCKSGKTYSSDPPHKLIVTQFNSCPSCKCMGGASIYANCYYVTKSGIVYYCDVRTLEHDPYR